MANYFLNIWRYLSLCSLLLLSLFSCSTPVEYAPVTEEERKAAEAEFKDASQPEIERYACDTISSISVKNVIASRLIASSYRHASRFSDAISQCQMTFALAQAISDTIEMTKALNDLATNFRRIGSLGEATQYHYKALQLADEFSDKSSSAARKNKTIAFNGIGNIDLTLKYYEEAKYYFREAMVIETSLGSDLGQAINLANIGSIFSYEEQYDSAFAYYCHSMAHNKRANSTVGISLCYNALGEIYEKREMIDSARVQYQLSYDILLNDPDRWHWLVSCLSLGRVEMLLGNKQKAAELLSDAYRVAIEIDAPEQAETACALLAQYEQGNNNPTRALNYLQQSKEFSNRVQNERQNNSFLNTRVNYEREKGAREVQLIAEEKARNERVHYLTIVGISIFAVLLLIIISQSFTMLRIQRQRNEELKETNDTKDKLFSVISHDLKNPAIAQCNALQLLATYGESLPKEQLKKTYSDLHKSAVVQVDLLNNLLNWTRLQMGRMQFEPSKMDICGTVTDVTEFLALQAKAKDISFVIPDAKGIFIFADNNMVSIIVRNIVSNAIKFSHKGGSISFDYEVSGNMVVLVIADKGIGMPPDMLESIFTKGHSRSMKGTAGEQGSGLGLAVCLDMAKANKGKIEGTSTQGVGTTFRIYLPKA